MGFQYSEWVCDNCGKKFWLKRKEGIVGVKMMKFAIASDPHMATLPRYVQNIDEILCMTCFESYETARPRKTYRESFINNETH